MRPTKTKVIALLMTVVMLGGCAANSGGNASSEITSAQSLQSSSSAESTIEISSEAPSSALSSTPVSSEHPEFEKYSGTRDPWLWPFSSTSIWNMPIGSDAQLIPAGLKQGDQGVCVDIEHHIIVPEGSPKVNILAPSAWNKRWPGTNIVGEMYVPADLIIADANENVVPNACSAFLMPDGRTIKQLEPTCRIETGNAHIVGHPHPEDQDIYGEGIKGTHYGSGLSAIGGSIRKGELTSDEPIRHALKLNVCATIYLYYDKVADKGYVWPADRHDGYAKEGDKSLGGYGAYNGTNPYLRMGSLLTIPQDLTAEELGVKTEVGKKIFYALQNYGCYIADDNWSHGYGLSVEDGVPNEVSSKYGISIVTKNAYSQYLKDMTAMIESLYIVTNNSPTSIGGGGTPCKPLAPDFEQ